MPTSTAPTFSGLPPKARLYLASVPVLTVVAIVAASLARIGPELDPVLLGVAIALCAVANLFEVFAPGHYSFQPNLVFFFGSAVLLPPWAIALVAAACFVPGWLVHRFPWYMVMFNVTNYALCGVVASVVVSQGALAGGSSG